MPLFLASKTRTSTPMRRRPVRRRPPASRLCLEFLEARCLLSFSPAALYSVGASPRAVVTGDFNGDGRLELAVANQASNTVSVLTGNGDGTFQAPQTFTTGTGPQSLAVGDFNGDGRLDLVTVNSRDVSVLLGIGNGTFQPARSIVLPGEFPPGYTGTTALPQAPFSPAVADVNGDGKLDLAISGSTSWTNSSTHVDAYVNVLLGNGDGSFTPKAVYHLANNSLNTINNPPALGLGDFNGDRKPDVVTVSTGGDGVSVWPGNGDGTLQAPVHSTSGTPFPLPTGGAGNSVVTGDLDSDGKLDLVTRSFDGNGVFVQKGNGDGTFQAPQTLAVGLPPATGSYARSSLQSVVLGDVNGDGKLDMTALASETHYGSYGYYGNYNPTTTSYANVLLGHGDGSFGLPTSSTLGSRAGFDSFSAATLADFNGDGRPDLAGIDSGANTVSVALNGNNWAFIDVSGFPSSSTAGVAGILTATIRDTFGNIDAGYRGTVQLSSTDPQAVLPSPYTFTAADGGTHTFAVTLKTAGTQSITVTDPVTAGLTGGQRTQVAAAALSRFSVSAFQSSQPIGTVGDYSVNGTDAYDNVVNGYTGTVHFSSTDQAAVLPADYTFTSADFYGHTFSATFQTAGLQTLTATDRTTPGITGSLANIEVTGASTFSVNGFPSPVVAGTAGSFTVQAYDVYGQPVVGYSGTVHFTSSDPSAVLPADYTFTAADQGSHTFAATFQTAGTQSITATATVNAGVTGTQGGITVNPAVKAITVVGFPSPVTAGVAGNFTLTARDASGNAATWYTGTVTFRSTDPQAVLPADYTFTAADRGTHTFAATLKTAGTRSITAIDTATGGLSGSEVGITVNPASPSKFLITAPSGVTSGVAFGLTITVQDAYGNVVTGYVGTIHFQSTDSKATLPVNFTFGATDKGVHTFAGLILRKRGNQTITVTDTRNSLIAGTKAVYVS